MSLFIIATVVSQMGNRWNTLGYKILNTTTGQCKLLSENSIRNNKLVLENAEFVNGELKATMGDFKRYTKLNASDGRPVGGRTLVILGKDSEGYMLCVEYPESDSDLIRRMSPAELKRQIKFYTGNMDGVKVANARVDNPDNVKEMIIRPIKGNFNVIKECPKYLENEFYFGKRQNGFSQNWKVRIIKNGMPFGNNPNKINEGNTIIEFYDISGDKEKFPSGQYVCSYYLSSIMEHKGTLSLYADVNAWTIIGANLEEIKEWAIDI